MVYAEPTPNDVLMGRGKPGQHSPGNVLFRNLIKARAADYHATDRSQLRDSIASEIMAEIEATGGRFLQLPNFRKDGPIVQTSWMVIAKNATRAKVKQALRDTMKSPNRSAAATTLFRYRVSPAGVVNTNQLQSQATRNDVSLLYEGSPDLPQSRGPNVPMPSSNAVDWTMGEGSATGVMPYVGDTASAYVPDQSNHDGDDVVESSNKARAADDMDTIRRSRLLSAQFDPPPPKPKATTTNGLESLLVDTFLGINQGSFEMSQSAGTSMVSSTRTDWPEPVESNTRAASSGQRHSASFMFGPRPGETNHHNPPEQQQQEMQMPAQQHHQHQPLMIPREVAVVNHRPSFASSFFPDCTGDIPAEVVAIEPQPQQPQWYSMPPLMMPPPMIAGEPHYVPDAGSAHPPYCITNHRYVFHQQPIINRAAANDLISSPSSFDNIWDSDNDLSAVE